MLNKKILVAVFAVAGAWVFAVGCGKFQDKQATGDAGAAGGGNNDSPVLDAGPVEQSDIVEVAGPADYLTDKEKGKTNDFLIKEPYFIHQTYRGAPDTTVTIQWATNHDDVNGSYVPRVWFNKSESLTGSCDGVKLKYAKQFVREGKGFNYRETLNGKETNNKEVSVQWEVDITGLEPGSRYCYRAGTWESFDMAGKTFVKPNLSPVYSFRTSPKKGAKDKFTVMLAGDSRGGYEEIKKHIGRLVDMKADFWLFNGDMNQFGNKKEWFQWFSVMTPLLSGTVLMPVQGNHETFADLYYDQFALPENAGVPEEFKEHAWSINYGNLNVTGLNSNTDTTVTGIKEWLDNHLAAVAADPDITWKIVIFHHPAYSASNHGSTKRVQDHWVPIFEKHKVDMVFSGHDHNYERSVPIKNNLKVEPATGVIYVTAGAFFSPGYGNGSDWWTVVSHHGDKGNYVYATVEGNKISLVAYSGDGKEELDKFELTK
ncbi:MAG: hypothetical protein GMKNLPBB_00876 [Myxococcota bacterium]|nr:hypothetical protein [Myxococcota bacterium]